MNMKNESVLKRLRDVVKKEVLREVGEHDAQPRSAHEVIVDITKAAANGIKALESLKKKQMPTQKASRAVESTLQALESIFIDMSHNPTQYLDMGDPNDVVRQHLGRLDQRTADLRDSHTPEGEPLVEPEPQQ